MKNIYYKNKIYFELLIWLVFFSLTTYFFRLKLDNDWSNSILATSAFVFAIVLAFSIANRKQRLDSIRMTLRKNDALFIKLVEGAKIFSVKESDQIRLKIDNLLINQLDYKLTDIENTTPLIIDLVREVNGLKIHTDNLADVKSMLMDTAGTIIENQKEVVYWINDKMRRIEWFSLISLASVMLIMLNSMNIGSILSIIVIALLSTSIVVLFIVLREINKLEWQERKWIWNPLIDVFHELELLPYIPDGIAEARNINHRTLKPMKAYRKSTYVHDYPDFSDKIIEIIEL